MKTRSGKNPSYATRTRVLTDESIDVNNGIRHQIKVVAQFALEKGHDFGTGESAPLAVGFDSSEELEDDVTGFRFDDNIGNVDVDVDDALLMNQ